MVIRKIFAQVPLVLLALASFALAVDAAPVHLDVLTPETFKPSIAKGVWFVEHFSPYCHHCKQFAPTWEKLVEQHQESGVQLAQVNCAVNGDLCDANGVKGYPQMNLYKDGQFVEEYKGNRDFDVLTEYLAKHIESAPPSPPQPPPLLKPTSPPTKHTEILNPAMNPTGSVLDLNENNFDDTLGEGPVFIKYFAPWCGHCKKLAPTWTQLARHMQHKVNIAEVNCEDHGTLCKSQDVQGYPMLYYYNNGVKSEYTGGRKFDQLKAFAEKASAPPVQELDADDLQSHIDNNAVVYLLLHSEGSNILNEVNREAHVLLGSPTIYTSDSPELFARFKVPIATPWALLALKDHDASTPASIHYAPSHGSPNLKPWLLANRLPTTMELTQDTFQMVMNAEHKPLVVIAAVNQENKESVARKFKDIGAKWRVRTASGSDGGVVFSWMDAERWASWLKSMYGITVVEGQEPPVVIADHSRLIYYEQDKQGKSFVVTSTSLFPVLEGIPKGEITARHSENIVERMARYLNHKLTSIEYYATHYPMHVLAVVALAFVAFFFAIKRATLSDESDYRTSKSGRLD